LERGELDALFSIYLPKLFLEGSPRIARLFPDFKRVEQEYYRRTRIFPIMHTLVIRKDVYRDSPWGSGEPLSRVLPVRAISRFSRFTTPTR